MTYSGSRSNNSAVASGKLAKATLVHQPTDKSKDIEFMFNPTELVFQQSMRLNESQGARTAKGLPKVTFAYPEACSLSLSNILFDTYEQGTSVIDAYVSKLIKALDFDDSGDAANKRPPIYIFTWGDQQYLRCFVEQITYKLTLFLPDGTPVQARVDMTLKEIDESSLGAGESQSASPNRSQDSRSNRTTFGR